MRKISLILVLFISFWASAQEIEADFYEGSFHGVYSSHEILAENSIYYQDPNTTYSFEVENLVKPSNWVVFLENDGCCGLILSDGFSHSGNMMSLGTFFNVRCKHSLIPGEASFDLKLWPDNNPQEVTTISYTFILEATNALADSLGFGVDYYSPVYTEEPSGPNFDVDNPFWNYTGEDVNYEFKIASKNLPNGWSLAMDNASYSVIAVNAVFDGVIPMYPSEGDKFSVYCSHNGINGVGLAEIQFWPVDDASAVQSINYTLIVGGVSIEETALTDLDVFPNPCADHVRVQSSSPFTSNSTLRFVDLNGRLVGERSFDFNGEVSLDGLPQGMYFVQLWTNHEPISRVKQVVVQ